MATIAFTLDLCIECTLHHSNGECGTCSGCTGESEQFKPLSNLNAAERRGLALGTDEHSDYCTEDDRAEGCDCGSDPFRTFTCGGCGERVAGECHDAVVFTI